MASIKCVILEDDPIAKAIMLRLIQQHPEIELLAAFATPEAAANWFTLHRNAELLFMDVELNGQSGIQLYRALPYKPDVIFTTAHEDFAYTAYELGAIDSLKKPITQERFLRAIEKVKFARSHTTAPIPTTPEPNSLFLKAGRNFVKLRLNDVLFFEAARDYIKVVTTEKSHMILMTMCSMMEKLDPEIFLRVGKSYIVNKHKVVGIIIIGVLCQLDYNLNYLILEIHHP
jgi:DNA-binding LytR/AlgR family response regulator